VDWNNWSPLEEAVLCFVCSGSKVLLIEKKRGLGQGKINAPGGRIEPGETPVQAAIRETREEVGITPAIPRQMAVIDFQFTDGYALRCHVFVSCKHEGSAHETPEAIPFWCEQSQIPYDRMWADDKHWLPRVLAGEMLRCRFVFDGDQMLDMQIQSGIYDWNGEVTVL